MQDGEEAVTKAEEWYRKSPSQGADLWAGAGERGVEDEGSGTAVYHTGDSFEEQEQGREGEGCVMAI